MERIRQAFGLVISPVLSTKSPKSSLDKLAMVASTVSSKMIERMAEVENFKFVECLTGE